MRKVITITKLGCHDGTWAHFQFRLLPLISKKKISMLAIYLKIGVELTPQMLCVSNTEWCVCQIQSGTKVA
jgi:hypothetical protein